MKRNQTKAILADLKKKMVLLAGPRQAGKTTLAKELLGYYKNSVYLNYDDIEHRKLIESRNWLPNIDFIVLDELHKMPDWKNYLKGLYDTKPAKQHLLVTGSARLELFKQAGDSLAGRYFLHRLLPFSISELATLGEEPDLERLLTHGNFPEPYLASELDAKRWRQQYIDSLVGTDVLSLEKINGLRAIQTIFELLRHRVGSPLSYNSLAQDVGISPNTVRKYISILEALYIIFLVRPYHKNIARSILKEPKAYFYDVGLVQGDKGLVVENFVAISLLKHCYGLHDYQAHPYDLCYLRTKDQRELDFALVLDNKIEQAIEVKLSDTKINNSLNWFVEQYGFSATQVVYTNKPEYSKGKIKVRQLEAFLKELWPTQ